MAEVRARGLRHAFRALRYRDFALFWSGAFVSSIGMWMQNVTVPFLLHEATGSASWVGLGAFAQFAPVMVMSPLGGSLADRRSRRTILVWNQVALLLVALALWLSVRGGEVRPGMLVALVGLGGVVTGLGIPAWQSYVAELVPREALLNAVTLNSAQFNASRAIGFTLGGFALYSVGPGLSFFANALSYVAVLVALGLIGGAGAVQFGRGAAAIPAPEPGLPLGAEPGDVRAAASAALSAEPGEGRAAGLAAADGVDGPASFRLGVAYVREHPGIRLAVVAVGIVIFLGGPVIQLASVIARDAFGVDERGYGFLAAAFGIGAMVASVVLGAYGDGVRRSRLVVAAVVIYGGSVVALAATPAYAGGVLAMTGIGVAYLAVASVLNTSVQLAVEDRYRGRVLALYVMVVTGAYPLGSLMMGLATDAFGVRAVVGAAGAGLLAYAALLAARPHAVSALDGPDADADALTVPGPAPEAGGPPAGEPDGRRPSGW